MRRHACICTRGHAGRAAMRGPRAGGRERDTRGARAPSAAAASLSASRRARGLASQLPPACHASRHGCSAHAPAQPQQRTTTAIIAPCGSEIKATSRPRRCMNVAQPRCPSSSSCARRSRHVWSVAERLGSSEGQSGKGHTPPSWSVAEGRGEKARRP
eukprot:6205641-Pleurochrysis_carterae.AAC.1